MADSVSRHSLEFVVNFPGAAAKIQAFQQLAENAFKPFKAGAGASGGLTNAQRAAAATAQGQAQAGVSALYRSGGFGPVGSPSSIQQSNAAKAAIRKEFEGATAGLSAADTATYKKLVKQAEALHLKSLETLVEAAATDAADAVADTAQTKKFRQKARLSKAQLAANAELVEKLGLKELEEQEKQAASAATAARARARTAQEALKEAREASVAAQRNLKAQLTRQETAIEFAKSKTAARVAAKADAEAAAAAVAKAKAQKRAAGPTSDVGLAAAAANEALIAAEAAELSAYQRTAAREQSAKDAKVQAAAQQKVLQAAELEAVLADEQVDATAKKVAATEKAVINATQEVANSEASKVLSGQKVTQDKRTNAEIREAEEREKKAKRKTAATEEGRAAVAQARATAEEKRTRTDKGEKIYGVGEQPDARAADIKRRIMEADRRLLAKAEALGVEPPELLRKGTAAELEADRIRVGAELNAIARQRRKAAADALKAEQAAAAAAQAGLSSKSVYDQEATAAAAARAETIRMGVAKEAAYLQQLDGINRGINAATGEILTLTGQERAIKQARVALEESSAARAIEELGLRDTIVSGKFDTEKEAALQKLSLEKRLAADGAYTAARTETAAITQRQALLEANALAKKLAADTVYIAATEEAAILKQQAALQELAFKSGSAVYQQQEALISAQTAGIKVAIRNAELEILTADEAAIAEKARGIVLEEQYNRLLAREVQAQAAQAGLTRGGVLGRLTGAGGRGGGGRYGIGEGQGAGQFFGGGLATTLKYALPSALLFGAAAGIAATVKSAEELERQMSLIEGQFQATDDAADFPQFKKSILEIARDSGLAAEEVAKIGFQLKGAFDAVDAASGEDIRLGGFSGDALVEEQLRASAEISKVTGLTQEEIVDSLTATSLAFGTTFREIGDVTLSLQGRFGVLAKEIIPFLGDIAPVAKEAGFTLEEFATIAAITQQKSGRSGTALAEAYGRVLPAITEAKAELIDLASRNEALNNQKFLSAVGEGDVGEIFLQIAGAFNEMDKSSQDFVIQLLGGRREASAILSAFSDGNTLMNQIRETEEDRNGLAERYAVLQESLAQKVDKLKEKFRQLGVEIFESGLGDVLKLLADIIALASTAATTLLQAFGAFNGALQGIPGKLLAILAVVKLLQAAGRTQIMQRLGTDIGARALYAGDAIRTGVQNRALGARTFARNPIANTRAAAANVSPGLAYGAAALGVLELYSARNEQGAALQDVGRALTERLREKTEEDLQTFVDERQSVVDQIQADGWAATVGAFVTGAKNIRDRAIDAQQLEAQPGVTAGLEEARAIIEAAGSIEIEGSAPGVRGGRRRTEQTETFGIEEIDEIMAEYAANPTDNDAYDNAIEALEALKAVSSENDAAITGAIEGAERILEAQEEHDEAVVDAAEAAQDAVGSLESIKASYESGNASLSELRAAYGRLIRTTRESLELTTVDDPALVALLQETIKARNEAISGAIIAASEFDAEILSLTGGQTDSGELERLQGLLENRRITDPTARRQIVTDILALQQSMLEARAEAADDASAAVRILRRGTRIPRGVRVELIRQQLDNNNVAFQRFIDSVVNISGTLGDRFRDQITAALAGGRRGTRALIRQLRRQAREIRTALQYIGGLDGTQGAAAELAAIEELIRELERQTPFGVRAPGRVRGSAEARRQAREEEFQQASEYAQAVADAQEEEAEKAQEAAEELQAARDDYFLSLIENDPVAVARQQQQIADRHYREATTEAERIRAQAERVRADRQLQEALQDVFSSQFELVTAMLNYTGDTVGVAQVALKQARQNLAYLQRSGAGDAEINRAKAAVIDAQAGLRDARLNRRLEDYAFLYDMDRINRQQYIAYLMQLRETPDLTRDQLRALDRQIKQLRDELGADFQFNLPTTLGLPTLYEVRRTAQTPGGVGAYYDNSVVTINVNVENGADLQALERVLSESVGTNVNGTIPRRY